MASGGGTLQVSLINSAQWRKALDWASRQELRFQVLLSNLSNVLLTIAGTSSVDLQELMPVGIITLTYSQLLVAIICVQLATPILLLTSSPVFVSGRVAMLAVLGVLAVEAQGKGPWWKAVNLVCLRCTAALRFAVSSGKIATVNHICLCNSQGSLQNCLLYAH